MGSSSKKNKATPTVVGHRYFRSLHLGLCHGAIDAVRAIYIKDKVAWSGNNRRSATGLSVTGYVNSPGLFGGEDLEGGVQGFFEVGHGGFDQILRGVNANGTTNTAALRAVGVPNPFMPAKGTHYRGIAVLNLMDFYWGTNPYLADIAVEVERYWRDWYPEVAQIGVDANPAHIIYEAVTNDQWGLGYSSDELDLDGMRVAAGKLFTENLGLSLSWSEQQTIEDFIGTILTQIDASFYFNPRLGKWTLKLVRSGDPVVHHLDPDNCKLNSFSRRALGETVNELTVQWVNPITEEYQGLTVQDTANIMATGQTIPGTRNYGGVRNENLAGRLAQRDLQAISATLAMAEVVADRSAWDLNPGDVVTFSWPDYGISMLRLRVTATGHTQSSGDIKLNLMEDVFGKGGGSFAGENPIEWVDERLAPSQFDVLVSFELPFWYVYQNSSGVVLDPEVTFGAVLPVTSNSSIRSADLYAKKVLPSGPLYELADNSVSTPSAILDVALTPSALSNTQLRVTSFSGRDRIGQDSYVVIGDGDHAEMARVIGRELEGAVQLERGIMDTHPRSWPQGTRVYFIGEGLFTADATARSMEEVVDYKVTMQTSVGATTLAEVPVTSALLVGRQGRPYSVANVTVGGMYWPTDLSAVGGGINVSWRTRNRLFQNGDRQVRWSEGNIVPEEGTTILVFFSQGGTVVASQLISNPAVFNARINMVGVPPGETTINIRALRGAMENYQDFTHTFNLSVPTDSEWDESFGN